MMPGHPTIAVSSWSLHRTIGLSWWDSPTTPARKEETWGQGSLAMLDFAAACAERGIRQIHLCHFHVERRDAGWLEEFRTTMAAAGVNLSMLLVDDGDIAHPTEAARDIAWIEGWIETAARLGARSVRVIAGKQKPSEETLRRAADGLKTLVQRGKSEGVRVATENWLDLTAGPDEIDYLLDSVGDDLDLLADFGNWKTPSKYDDLERILRRATDTHAKAHFDASGVLDSADFERCLDACDAAVYGGPFTLIYEGEDADEWAALERERRFVIDSHPGAVGRVA
jgi:sugar phosphate isomerase/epimerase